MKLSNLIPQLGHPDKEVQEGAKNKIIEYFSQQDLNLPNRELGSLLKKLKRMEHPAAIAVLQAYSDLRNITLRYEQELKDFVKQSRIEDKEFDEAKEFYLKIQPFFGDVETLVDCGAGNGLAGIIWALEGKAERVILVDKEINTRYDRLLRYLQTLKKIRIEYHKQDINISGVPSGDALVAIHACNSLTDRVIGEGIRQRVPLAVMPCCHSESSHLSKEQLAYFKDKAEAIDVARVLYIQQKGYDVHLRNIDPRITDKNRMIIGVPKAG